MRAPRRRWKAWTARAASAALPAALVAAALLHPNYPASQLDLNDAAVWVTNSAQLTVGRFNTLIQELNAGLGASDTDVDVLQDGAQVVVRQGAGLAVVDPVMVRTGEPVALPPGAQVSMAGGSLAVLDPADGRVWARTFAGVGGLRIDVDKADVTLGPGGHVTAAADGSVFAVSASGAVTRLRPAEREAEVTEEFQLASGHGERVDAVSAVGGTLVALGAGRLATKDRTWDVSQYGSQLVLQQVGPAADAVALAGQTGLVLLPLSGGAAHVTPSGGPGEPAAPVHLAGCVYAAWATASGNYAKVCAGAGAPARTIDGLAQAQHLVFRVNRGQVVLNDMADGGLWLPEVSDRELTTTWADLVPSQETPTGPRAPTDSLDVSNVTATCDDDAPGPVAVDDSLGVRPGRTQVLSVIDNDSVSTCGVLVITEVSDIPASFGTLSLVYGGRAIQADIAPSATGSVTFTYTVSDGRGQTPPSTGTVTLSVHGPDTNAAPVQVRPGVMTVEQGGSAEHWVLGEFQDPDGDEMVLTAATSDGPGTVMFRPDGTLTYHAAATEVGRREISVTVSDTQASTTATLAVDVRPSSAFTPELSPIQLVTQVDTPVTVRPLDALRTHTTGAPRLAGVDQVPGARVALDSVAGTFTFTAAVPRTYYVPFLIAVGDGQVQGVARIDVHPLPAKPLPPVTGLDVVYLVPGRTATVRPLDNDVDPQGGVLVLQDVSVPADSPLRAAVVDRQEVSLSSTQVLEQPVSVLYTVSGGFGSASGTIRVMPAQGTNAGMAPAVTPIEVHVRTGGVVTIPVLDYAADPAGEELRVDPAVVEPPGNGQGLLFVSGQVVRFQAPGTPMTVRAVVDVVNESGARGSAQLTIRVHASDAAGKSPPRPRDVEARAYGGDSVRITIPLVGIDPDGDGVALLGLDQAPNKGRITEVGPDYLMYEAYSGEAGVDTFSYAVEDWAGQRAVARIRVGVVPRPDGAAQVVARDDTVVLAPGWAAQVGVLDNDLDVMGAALTLGDTLEADPGITAHVQSGRIAVKAPATPGTYVIGYSAVNSRGGRAGAVLRVIVDPDASVQPPVARDVVVPARDTIGKTAVDVDVLAVADNPSGPHSDLAAEVDPSAARVASVLPDGRVRVTLTNGPQMVPYVVRNTASDAVASHAFISVPALGDFPPVLRPKAPQLVVAAGSELIIPLATYVQVAPGKSPSLASPDTVSATRSDGSALVQDSATLRFRAPADYAGPASITAAITDAAGPADTSARTATLSFAIRVVGGKAAPPVFQPSVVEVAQGEDPVRVELAAITQSATGDPSDTFTFRLGGPPPAGFSAQITGGVLLVSAATSTPRGTTASLPVIITYNGTEELEAAVQVRAVASTKPLASLAPVELRTGVGGVSTEVDVMVGAYNPFPDQPLRLVQASVVEGSGTARLSGTKVVIQPDSGYVGRLVARVRVGDATADPAREVDGLVVLWVRGAPDTPAPPTIVETGDGQVTLSWMPPDNNGEPVTGYRVVVGTDGRAVDCPATTCVITGLVNAQPTTFTLQAVNAVGWSQVSGPSAPATPDVVPDAPGVPLLVRGDGTIDATWPAATTRGSAVTHYSVEVSPAPPAGAIQDVEVTSLHITGLTNGVAYRVRVQAHNQMPTPGPFSAWSQPMTPARAPDAPVVRAERVDRDHITVSWDAPANGGAAIEGYEVQMDGGTPVSLPAGQLDYTFETTAYGHLYTFTVRAANAVGSSAPGSAQAATFAPPGPVEGLRADAPPGAGVATFSWRPPGDTGGRPIEGYVVECDCQQDAVELPAGTTSWTTPAMAGSPQVSVTVRARNATGAELSEPQSQTARITNMPTAPPRVEVRVNKDPRGMPATVSVDWGASDFGGLDGAKYSVALSIVGTNIAWDTGARPPATTLTTPLPRGWPQGATFTIQAVVTPEAAAGAGPSATGQVVVGPFVPTPGPTATTHAGPG